MSSRRRRARVRSAYELALMDGVQHPLIQSGACYGEANCYGCGRRAVILFDANGAWCPSCGGAELVPGAIDLDYTIDTGKARLAGASEIHLTEQGAKTTLCFPEATVGRMVQAGHGALVTCTDCVAVRDSNGTAATA